MIINKDHVIIKASLEISKPDNDVEYSLFYESIFDLLDFDFEGFKRINMVLNNT